ncbi:BamA/TamA family outer membrane protein [Vibrio sp. THAF190c]|uniref:BamA/TamA family outer membrane protein n=1 Tax=Vibrio sp. THAF190c TaxID=2587865 RepID=UPI001267DAC8|nr:BamA/TamA family outer membrane protein [Vibrio sp. THAF190c]QFT13551.1 hypothetical protein FIV04_26710 [Vibrio sp. THAF190c]
MKKLLLAGLIASVCSGAVVAAEDTESKKEEGVRFTVPVGPFYDPIFDLAGSVIPTFLYETTEGAETSQTSLYGIYGTNGNYVIKANSNNYFGSDSEWLVFGDLTYTYAKLDVMDFLGPNPTVEAEQTSLQFEFAPQYKIFENTYVGPSFFYANTEFERPTMAADNLTLQVIPDKKIMAYGAQITSDFRNNKQTPTDGFYFKGFARNVEAESTNGLDAEMCHFNPLAPCGGPILFTLNGTDEYLNINTDARYYMPVTDSTTVALRQRVEWNGDDAPETIAELNRVANGFTMEIAGRSAVGADVEVRTWITDKIGVVGMAGVAKAVDVLDTGDDSAHFSFGGGLRYMLVPEDKLSMRLDVTYNDQEEDNILVFFNVGENF